jgi:hypothetical protein
MPTEAADIAGTWTQVGPDTRTWTLIQQGPQAVGQANLSHENVPDLGAVSSRGGVLGTVILGTFTFAETYEGVSISSRPSPNSCYIDTDGRLTISGNTMTGSYNESIGCAGVRVAQFTRSIVMQRR